MKYLERIIRLLKQIPASSETWLVGGTVRDVLLSRPVADIDLAVADNPREFAMAVAGQLDGSFFALDEGRETFRVSLHNMPGMHVDVARLQGGTIEDDLANRDFTINAIAVPIAGFEAFLEASGSEGSRAGLVDLFGGVSDLEMGKVRVLGERQLADDPLRLLRAFRIAGQLGFKVDDNTLSLIQRHAGLIAGVSVERVREEIYAILALEDPAAVFRALWDSGLMSSVFPETADMEGMPQGEPHVHDLKNHSLRTMEFAGIILDNLDAYFGDNAGGVREYLEMFADGGLRMAGLVRLCALLHDVGKPPMFRVFEGRIRFIGHDEAGAEINKRIAERLKLSQRAAGVLSNVARHHMRPLHMSRDAPSGRAVYRFVRDVGDDLPASLIVALADAFATRDRPDVLNTDVEGVVRMLSGYYYGEYRAIKAEPLITGNDLIEALGLNPGPVFSIILKDVEDVRAGGEISSREEALEYVRENLARFINENGFPLSRE